MQRIQTKSDKPAALEAATSRTIRIGSSKIGLIGLDMAMNLARARPENRAVDFLYQEIKRKNYVPPGMEKKYRDALSREYRRYLHGDENGAENLVIRIYGPGCVSCNGLQNLVLEILAEMNLAADLEQIHDPDEIGRAGILRTPALMINGTLKSSGLAPTRAQVEQWLRDIHD